MSETTDIAATSSPRAAVAFVTVATALIAGTTLLAKAAGTDALGEPLHPLQVSHARFLFAWMAIASMWAIVRPRFATVNWGTHVARTVCGWAGATLMFAAAARMPLSDATAISFLSPVFAMILAIPLLGERVGPWRWIAAGIAFVGAMVLIRPGTDAVQLAGLLALGAALAMGFENIFIKRLSGWERPLQILFVNNSIGFAIATVAVIFVWEPPTPAQWAALAGIGVLMLCAQAGFIQAMRRADASFVTPYMYLTLVFAAFYDFVVFTIVPTGLSIAGAVIVVAGAGLLAWRDQAARQHRQARLRNGPEPSK
ncbi:MAG: DMT family transporter [Pseudomonadota bacterium]